jgi:hypothetical protein
MAGSTAAVRHDGRRPFHDRLPVRIGHVGDEHLTVTELMHLLSRLEHSDRAGTDLLPDRPTLDEDRSLLAHPEALH